MSSTLFCYRLQALKDSAKYSENAIAQFEKIASDNNGTLPKTFYLKGLGSNTISKMLNDLTHSKFDISAPNGPTSSLRKIVLR